MRDFLVLGLVMLLGFGVTSRREAARVLLITFDSASCGVLRSW